jgi:hypothetical protein
VDILLTSISDIDELEFKPIEEVWNEYELKDGTKIKGRTFVTRVAEIKNAPRPPNADPKSISVNLNVTLEKNFQVFAPKERKSNPTQIPDVNTIPEDQKEEVKVLTYSEPWNTYEIIKNGTIVRVKIVVSDVYRIKNVYDQFGQPFYMIKNSPIFDFKPNQKKEKFA